MPFTHQTLPQRVVFATGEAALAVHDEVLGLSARRVMLIASEREGHLADPISERIPVAVRHGEVVMHVPTEVADRARAAAAAGDVDAIVTVGGGSTTGLGKAIALTSGLPLIAVPTTYAGSEATDVWGLTNEGAKKTGSDPRVLPRSVIYDASLLTSLPPELTVASGLNALAHSIDAMWGPRADPIDRTLAEESIRALAAGLPQVHRDGAGLTGIEQTLYGAYLAAVSFAGAGSGMHHKICHVLGGMFDLPHAQTHAIVLPHVLATNAPHAPEAEERIARAFGSSSAVQGLADLRGLLSAPTALKDCGMPRDGIGRAVDRIIDSVPDNNPGPVTQESVTALLEAAWEGKEPS